MSELIYPWYANTEHTKGKQGKLIYMDRDGLYIDDIHIISMKIKHKYDLTARNMYMLLYKEAFYKRG